MNNETKIFPILREFHDKIFNSDFVIDSSGTKTVEIVNATIKLDPQQPILDFKVRKTPIKYAKAELEWYDSQELHVEKIVKHAKTWERVSDKDGYVNSNYGWLIYSKENFNQFDHCIAELNKNKHTRKAVMIYQRPSMWIEYDKNGRSDFICTDGVQLFIRNNRFIYIVKQRSCDFIFGFFNDFYWHCEVYKRALTKLREAYPDLEYGDLYYNAFSLHVYERHFDMIKEIGDIYGF